MGVPIFLCPHHCGRDYDIIYDYFVRKKYARNDLVTYLGVVEVFVVVQLLLSVLLFMLMLLLLLCLNIL